MPLNYIIDKQLNTVFCKARGHVSTAEVREHFHKLASDPNFQPDCKGLVDLTCVKSTDFYYKQMKELLPEDPWGAQSVRAVVVKSPLVFGLTRTFMLLSKRTHGKISVFYNIEKALKSLGVESYDVPWPKEQKHPNIIECFMKLVGREGFEPSTR